MRRIIIFTIAGVMLILTSTAIRSRRALLYDNYTLTDTFNVRGECRTLQLEKIDSAIESILRLCAKSDKLAVIDNYKNRNGQAALVEEYTIDSHNSVQDRFGVIRHQAAPLYPTATATRPTRYLRDGSLAAIVSYDSSGLVRVILPDIQGEWLVPQRYIKRLSNRTFRKFIVVDRKYQSITVCERSDSGWWLRAANPATTGLERPPYKRATPLGIFVIRSKSEKMMFLHDGSTAVAGFSPYASRFSGGAYIHGIPTNYPSRTIIEWSRSLGTIPRSHMCVRCATSFAHWIYKWAECDSTAVAVIE